MLISHVSYSGIYCLSISSIFGTWSTPEASVFRHYYTILRIAIQTPDHMADVLYSRCIIDSYVKENAQNIMLTHSVRCRFLLDALERKIKTDPSGFYAFIDILLEEPTTEEIAHKLLNDVRCKYSKQ